MMRDTPPSVGGVDRGGATLSRRVLLDVEAGMPVTGRPRPNWRPSSALPRQRSLCRPPLLCRRGRRRPTGCSLGTSPRSSERHVDWRRPGRPLLVRSSA